MRIFSYDDLVTKYIPTQEDFEQAIEAIKRGNPAPDGTLLVLIGSTLGGQTVTSDLDLVWYRDVEADFPTAFLNDLGTLAQRVRTLHHVPIGFILVTTEDLRIGSHNLSSGLRDHILWAIRNNGHLQGSTDLIQPFVQNMMQHVTREPLDDARTYASRKIHSTRMGMIEYASASEERRLRFLSDLLSTPLHLTRKVLSLLDPEFDPGWSKPRLEERLRRRLGRTLETECLWEIVQLSRRYTFYVEGCRTQTPTLEMNNEWMNEVYAQAPRVLLFLRKILENTLA